MDISKMIANLNPEMLQKGLKQISPMLSPEQSRQMEAAIKNFNKDELGKNLNSLSADDFKNELSQNPKLLKNLAQNPELMNQLAAILKKK